MLVAGLGAGVAYAVESGDSTADATEQTQVASGQETSESQDASEDSVAEGAEGEAGGTADTTDAQNAGQDDAIGDDAKTDDGSTDKVDTGVKVADTEDAADGSDAGISTLAVDDPDHTVQGVSPRGTTINVFDYWIHDNRFANDQSNPSDYTNKGINAGHVLKFGAGMGNDANENNISSSSVNYWTQSAAPRQGIVATQLGDDGYPTLSGTSDISTDSLSYLFNEQSTTGKAAFMDVDGLLQVDSEGYYYYNSQDNFAQFNDDGEGSGDFTLYKGQGVDAGGSSPNGQFFPFNNGRDVFTAGRDGLEPVQIWDQNEGRWRNIKSTDANIHHYFGLNMSTRFVQPDGGVIDDTDIPMTYEFSGDDDVWIYIDGVLVGDLGGIHDAASISIDFRTGDVIINEGKTKAVETSRPEDDAYLGDDGKWYKLVSLEQRSTLGDIMRGVGVTTGLSDNTFADGTYHTLDFFYLERGNTDSNMSLKYNLVVPPETDIVKVDQDGEGVKDAEFKVYVANANYETQGAAVCTATTGADGSVVLLDAQGMPITFDQLWDLYGGSNLVQDVSGGDGGRRVNLVLRETKVPDGYRSAGDMHMYLWHKDSSEVRGPDDVNLLLADMSVGNETSGTTWQTGAYSQPTVLVTAPDQLTWSGGGSVAVGGTEMQEDSGRLFAIVEKKVNNQWVPVYGDQQNGWTVADSADMAAVQAADEATQASFVLASAGSYQALIDGLPGRIQDYVFFYPTDDGGEYRGAYFYTTAGTDVMNSANTHRVTNTEDFGRQFAAHLHVPNTINRVIVQKTDDAGNPVNGAEFTLYHSNAEGTGPANGDDAVVDTKTTKDLTRENDKIDLNGAAVFTHLNTGTYWIVETAAPAGYAINTTPAKVIVTDNGVYADAGETNDGVKVTRGVGRIVRSMLRFATADDIDATLNQIVAIPQTGRIIETLETGETVVGDWNGSQTVSGATKLHLQYDGDKAALDYNVVNPPTSDADRRFTVDTGIPYLKVQQCNNKTVANEDNVHVTDPRVFDLGDTDISGLFTGVTIVQVTDQRVGSLKISKTVTGENAPQGATFTFDITLADGEDKLVSGKFTARVYDADNNQPVADSISSIEFTDGKATVALQSGQYVVIEGLSVGTAYTVTEQTAAGYTPSYTVNNAPSTDGSTVNASVAGLDTNPGQIGQQVGVSGWAPNQTVAFTNKYAPSVTASFTIAKQIEGRDWLPDDTFSFLVGASENYGDAVTMPTDSGAVLGTKEHPVVINAETSDHETAYGDITFTKTGTYQFTVTEVSGDAKGMTYSDAEFTVTVEVENFGTDPKVTVERAAGADVDGSADSGTDTVTFINRFGRVAALPLTGGGSTARNVVLAGGGILLLAGAAWLLTRRRRA